MRLAVSLLAAIAAATPAFAALAPQYYEQARREAAEVVVIRVERVEEPGFFRDHGDCTVIGKITAVERGRAYRVGSPARITVPCMKPDANIPAGGVQWQSMGRLKASKSGRAFMTAPGRLALYQYEILK